MESTSGGYREYTWTITQDSQSCSSVSSTGCKTSLGAFMLSISKECEAVAKKALLNVNGKVRMQGRAGPKPTMQA